jgi:integrase/recombinase XerD
MSIEIGLRAIELTSLTWADVYDADGAVRQEISVNPAYLKGAAAVPMRVSSPKLRALLADYREKQFSHHDAEKQMPLFRSQRGGHMTAASMARLITDLYRQAGIRAGSSRSGRRTLKAKFPAAGWFRSHRN